MSVFFNGTSVIIPLPNVMFVERNTLGTQPNIVIVMRGAQHSYDREGNYDGRYGRPDCPGLTGEEAYQFLTAWEQYQKEAN